MSEDDFKSQLLKSGLMTSLPTPADPAARPAFRADRHRRRAAFGNHYPRASLTWQRSFLTPVPSLNVISQKSAAAGFRAWSDWRVASHELFLTRIARVEVVAAVTRRGRGNVVPAATAAAPVAQFRYDAAHQYNILEVTPALLADAERLAEVHGLRGHDAVQLAVTVEMHRTRATAGLTPLTFISADQELNVAATAEGLTVDNPAMHPLACGL